MIKRWKSTLKKTQELDAKRIRLRRFRETDEKDILEFGSDAETLEFLDWEGVQNSEDVKKAFENYYNVKPGVFAIELKENSNCIGAIDLRMMPEHEKAGFGYMLGRAYWNKGYMTEALGALLTLAFEILELNRVEAAHYVGNEASGRVMQKCGMRHEGTALQELKSKGIFRDTAHYGILREDWIAQNAVSRK